MLLPLKHRITYGPVPSRRLGRSLGINLSPPGRKLCSFDCQYCQYGFAAPVAAVASEARDFPTPAAVEDAVVATLAALREPPAWLTFSGNGEPTLHPAFPEVVDRLLRLRARLAPEAHTAILSNSTEVGRPEVRAALARLDARIMKLDAGSEQAFTAYNQPAAGLRLDDIVGGLAQLRDVTLQSLFTDGPQGNLGDVEAWLVAASRIRPLTVQVYTLDRESPNRGLLCATAEQLEAVRARLADRHIAATVYWR
jgi:wyosine [tRNA(Phe)-imidazoG37] synthetase (radical SAM superfamily)